MFWQTEKKYDENFIERVHRTKAILNESPVRIYRSKLLRRAFFPLLKILERDIQIIHHWTGDRIILGLYRHKNYWYLGKRREKETMLQCRRLIRPLDTVIDVGGHIGYLSLFFARCAFRGTVHVFEPGKNNLSYLRKNVAPICNIHVHEYAAGDARGPHKFYLDPITGQNNTLSDSSGIFYKNRLISGESKTRYEETSVEVVRLDEYLTSKSIIPDFIKIDTEGFEFEVLKGMNEIMRNYHPILLVEVTEKHLAISELLHAHEYVLHDEKGKQIDMIATDGNYFCVWKSKSI